VLGEFPTRFPRRVAGNTKCASTPRKLGPPNQALHLTGAAMLVSRDTTLSQRPRQVSFGVRRTTSGDWPEFMLEAT
jgi:hypothetical protein